MSLSAYATVLGALEDVLRMLNNHLSRKHPLYGESEKEICQWLN